MNANKFDVALHALPLACGIATDLTLHTYYCTSVPTLMPDVIAVLILT